MLNPGTRLGGFEVIGLVGQGGMGEVYRARDLQLGREVALKVLPEALAGDAGRVARFRREAQVLAALNHPHIAAIFGLEEAGGRLALAMELVEGPALAGPQPLPEAIGLARQICAGLEYAHERGIVHRDLKPGNIKLTAGGEVKLLDFGLAKALTGDLAAVDLANSPTLTQMATMPGLILGTAAYMAPEQAKGKAVDARADIWAFGCVLYELLAGVPAFAGETATDILAAVVTREPDWSRLPAATPPWLTALLQRTLTKDPRQRLQAIGEARIALERGASAAPAPPPRATPRRWLQAAVGVALGAAAAAGLAWYLRPAAKPAVSFAPVTFRAEPVFNARFAPDGSVVYSAAPAGNQPRLYIRRSDYPAPQPLGAADTELLAISRQGQLAVLTGARFVSQDRFVGTLAEMAMDGGAPRAILDGVEDADWSPDGNGLAIVREMDGESRLEFPVGHVLHQTAGYISNVRFAPDGRSLAFFDHPMHDDDRGTLTVVSLGGQARVIGAAHGALEGLAWSPDGRRLYFGTDPSGFANYVVAATDLAGRESVAATDTENLWPYDCSPGGDLLAAGNAWISRLQVQAPGAAAEQEFTWLDATNRAVIGADGASVLFTEANGLVGSNYALLLRNMHAAEPVRLGEGAAMGLSPDGRWALALLPGPPSQLMLYATGAGEKRELERGAISSIDSAAFFPSGRDVLVCGNAAGQMSRCYAQAVAGGPPRPVTPPGTTAGIVARDGQSVLAEASDGSWKLYPLAGGEPRTVAGLGPGVSVLQFTADNKAVLAMDASQVPAPVERVDLASGQSTQVRMLAPKDELGVLHITHASFADDGHAYAYSYIYNVSRLGVFHGVR